MRLERADASRSPARVELDLGPDGKTVAAQRAGDDGACSGDREHAIDEQASACRIRSECVRQQLVERRAEIVEALARRRRHPDDAGRRQDRAIDPIPDLLLSQIEGVLVDEIPLRQRDDPAGHTEHIQDRQVFLRLLTPALVGGHHEQDEPDGSDAGEHVGDETFVPRNVDEAHLASGGKLAPRIAEVDREPPPLLLVPSVGVHPGDMLDQ